MPATASSTVRKRRLSTADRRTGGAALSSPITSANYLLGEPLRRLRRHLPISWGGVSLPMNRRELAPPAPSAPPPHKWGGVSLPMKGRSFLAQTKKRGGACSGHRLDR